MISTVITTTTLAISSASASLSLISVFLLVLLLMNKEIINDVKSIRGRRLSRVLNVAILPLIFVFVIVIALQVASALH